MAKPLPTLSDRELNRALLARQMLLERRPVGVVAAIERLAGLQAQFSPSPYIALWSRLARFELADLERPIDGRAVVKATLMRSTLHLVSAPDYPYFAAATAEARLAAWRHPAFDRGLDLRAIARRLARFASGEPRSHEELLAFVADAIGGDQLRHRYTLRLAGGLSSLVHAPPSGMWKNFRAGRLITADAWLGERPAPSVEEATVRVVRRYLLAFGPATMDDIASWSSIRTPPLRLALGRLRTSLREFRDDRGRTLYDLARAPRPAAETPAPARFLPKWDSTLLAYVPPERVRILPEKLRKTVIRKNGDVLPTFLVDGMVAGTWDVAIRHGQAVLTAKPFGRLSRADQRAIADEGERLVRFMEPTAKSHGVRA